MKATLMKSEVRHSFISTIDYDQVSVSCAKCYERDKNAAGMNHTKGN